MITYHDPIMQLIHLQKIAIKRGNLENKYQIDADSSLGMQVPVTIYADGTLLQKMMTDRDRKSVV